MLREGYDRLGTYSSTCKPWADDFYFLSTHASASIAATYTHYFTGSNALSQNLDDNVFSSSSYGANFAKYSCGVNTDGTTGTRTFTYSAVKASGNISAALVTYTAVPNGAFTSSAFAIGDMAATMDA